MRVYVIGTADTKWAELDFVRRQLEGRGLTACLVDIGLRDPGGAVDVPAVEVLRSAPSGREISAQANRTQAMSAMAEGLTHWLGAREDLAGVIGLGGSCGTAMIAPAFQEIDIGVPKVLVSTVASGNVKPYVGTSDIAMIFPVTDIAGLNGVSRIVLSNASHALRGMVEVASTRQSETAGKPTIAMSMFGVTTACVEALRTQLEADHECLVFHATGTGGQAMEKLVSSGHIGGLLDVTLTEVADLLVGGVFPAQDNRLGAVIRSRIPYVGSCGALDIVNFGPRDTVPKRFVARRFHQHNAQVTLMRVTAKESARIGRWIAARLNKMEGPTAFVLPLGGISALDVPGKPFRDEEANAALFDAVRTNFVPGPSRRLIESPHHINDASFSDLLRDIFLEISQQRT